MFQQRAVSEDVPVVQVSLASGGAGGWRMGAVRMPKLLVLAGLASSAGEATRKLAENAVSVNGEKFAGKVLTQGGAGRGAGAAAGEEECAGGVGGVSDTDYASIASD